ncbi:hypothetical protein [Terriglobus roseus]|uniref:Uncharacterized protein n=1 Tax=Terriglobus roseus TaxID=392734 RepID=A0A1H4PGD5_9BACT|nr:hypothetical protein [Terriglobus roseus]SEC06465.1 hypothetical protein SAMN05443244_2554 [Terriglobus roseus]
MHVPFRTTAALILLLPLAGCMVQSRKGDNGDKDVAISTPLGGMSVKTDSDSVSKKVGLPLYPGAVLEKKKKEKDNDSGSADVDMNFGAFHLRVLALSFESTDSPAKITDFYKKALSQYSDVITCRHKQPVGTPAKTGLGLTCNDDNHVSNRDKRDRDDDDADETELKSGSPSRQHIVSIKSSGGGTRFGLVALELPRGDSKND